MIARWPDKLKQASVREDLVSILDLTPTTLAVAGLDVPSYMHGRVLFTEDKPEGASDEPSYLFFHRDRMDEVYELQRAARDRRWKYIRNFEPEKPYSQRLDYMDEMPMMQDWRRLAAEGKLVGGQKNWFQVPKPIEELYDTEKDPWELTNLAKLPEFADRLARMRESTETWQAEIGDTGMIPEAVLMEEMKPGGEELTTADPVILREDETVSIRCSTEGSSIVYRVQAESGWGEWQLFTKSFSDSGTVIESIASRLGYQNSQTVTIAAP